MCTLQYKLYATLEISAWHCNFSSYLSWSSSKKVPTAFTPTYYQAPTNYLKMSVPKKKTGLQVFLTLFNVKEVTTDDNCSDGAQRVPGTGQDYRDQEGREDLSASGMTIACYHIIPHTNYNPLIQCVKRLWAYLKEKHLQDPENKQWFTPDKIMAPVFGDEKIKCFTMSKYLKEHLIKPE